MENTNFKDLMKSYKLLILVLSLLLYGYCIFYYIQYYSSFHINYFQYCSFEEILMISVVFIIKNICILYVYNLIIYLLNCFCRYIFRLINIITLKQKEKESSNINQYKQVTFIYKFIRQTYFIDIIIYFVFLIMNWNDNIKLVAFSSFIIKLIIFSFITESISFNGILNLIFIFSFLSILGDVNEKELRRGNQTELNQTILLIDSTLYETGNNKAFGLIGETQSVLFLYDRKKDQSLILNKNVVKSVTISGGIRKSFKEIIFNDNSN